MRRLARFGGYLRLCCRFCLGWFTSIRGRWHKFNGLDFPIIFAFSCSRWAMIELRLEVMVSWCHVWWHLLVHLGYLQSLDFLSRTFLRDRVGPWGVSGVLACSNDILCSLCFNADGLGHRIALILLLLAGSILGKVCLTWACLSWCLLFSDKIVITWCNLYLESLLRLELRATFDFFHRNLNHRWSGWVLRKLVLSWGIWDIIFIQDVNFERLSWNL